MTSAIPSVAANSYSLAELLSALVRQRRHLLAYNKSPNRSKRCSILRWIFASRAFAPVASLARSSKLSICAVSSWQSSGIDARFFSGGIAGNFCRHHAVACEHGLVI